MCILYLCDVIHPRNTRNDFLVEKRKTAKVISLKQLLYVQGVDDKTMHWNIM